NDYFDTVGGVDTAEYTRALYAPHPLLSGLISNAGLKAAILACNLADVAIGLILLRARGWPVAAFALAGLFVSVFYVAPPLKLKHHGLGEPGVFVVWGPLMIGGTYYVTAGALPAWVWLASVPYALAVTTVLIGKHVDKYEQDKARGIHTLPVLLGRELSLRLNQAAMVAFYAIVLGLVVSGYLGVGVLIVAAALPQTTPYDFTGHWTGSATQTGKSPVTLAADFTTGTVPKTFTGTLTATSDMTSTCTAKGRQKRHQKVKIVLNPCDDGSHIL